MWNSPDPFQTNSLNPGASFLLVFYFISSIFFCSEKSEIVNTETGIISEHLFKVILSVPELFCSILRVQFPFCLTNFHQLFFKAANSVSLGYVKGHLILTATTPEGFVSDLCSPQSRYGCTRRTEPYREPKPHLQPKGSS